MYAPAEGMTRLWDRVCKMFRIFMRRQAHKSAIYINHIVSIQGARGKGWGTREFPKLGCSNGNEKTLLNRSFIECVWTGIRLLVVEKIG